MKFLLCLAALVLAVGIVDARKCTDRELKSHPTWCKDGNAPATPASIPEELKTLIAKGKSELKAPKKDGKGAQAFENPEGVDETPKDFKPSEDDVKDKKTPAFLEIRDILANKAQHRAPIKFAGAKVAPVCVDGGDLAATMAKIGAPGKNPPAATGVQVSSAAYQGTNFHHMFSVFAPLGKAGAAADGRCYDPAVAIAAVGSPINVAAAEYTKGCTPFRGVSLALQTYVQCIDPILGAVTGENWEDSLELYVERIARVAMKTPAAGFQAAVANWLTTHGWNAVPAAQVNAFAACAAAAGTQNALMCYPALTHGTGSLREGNAGGVQSHDTDWLEGGELVKDCRIHPSCGRIAATEVLGMALRPYSKFTFWDITTPSWNRCRAETGNQNCRLWGRCWLKAMRGVCAANANCCPTAAVQAACAADTSAAGCKNQLCQNP